MKEHEAAKESEPPVNTGTGSPFVTVSDVMNRLNAEIAEQLRKNDDASRNSCTGGFELQRRLPDGSARKATAREVETADFETKLSQAAAFVQTLAKDEDKFAWAETQRMYGNKLYQNANYKQAVDVYLTCLTVAAAKKDTPHKLLFGKVMNNLALTSMQLHWYRKTVQFCTMALEHLNELELTLDESSSTVNCGTVGTTEEQELTVQRSKLHFKRAKAYRLSGDYELARADLDRSSELLKQRANNNDDDDNTILQCMIAIQKEKQLLTKCMTEAKRNKVKQQRAMQQLLGGKNEKQKNGDAKSSACTLSGSAPPVASSRPTVKALYDDADERPVQRRTHSTIRATPRERDYDALSRPPSPDVLSYWQLYWHRIGFQAQRLLDWLDEREKQRNMKQD